MKPYSLSTFHCFWARLLVGRSSPSLTFGDPPLKFPCWSRAVASQRIPSSASDQPLPSARDRLLEHGPITSEHSRGGGSGRIGKTTPITYRRKYPLTIGTVSMSKSAKGKQRAAANTAESASMSTNERVLKECHELYNNNEKGCSVACLDVRAPPVHPVLFRFDCAKV